MGFVLVGLTWHWSRWELHRWPCNPPCRALSSALGGDGNAPSWDVPKCFTVALPASRSPATQPASLASFLVVARRNERPRNPQESKEGLLFLEW